MGFGFYATAAKKRARKRGWDCNLTAEGLKELFDVQNGLCAVTGVPLKLNSSRRKMADKDPCYASLDRLDNTQGYVVGNIQFVALAINYMRNTFSLEQIKLFLQKAG